jgi:hypothetical protein
MSFTACKIPEFEYLAEGIVNGSIIEETMPVQETFTPAERGPLLPGIAWFGPNDQIGMKAATIHITYRPFQVSSQALIKNGAG